MAIQMLGGLSEVLEVSAEVVAHRAQPTRGHTLVLSPAIVCLFPPYPDDLRHRAPLCVLFCLCGYCPLFAPRLGVARSSSLCRCNTSLRLSSFSRRCPLCDSMCRCWGSNVSLSRRLGHPPRILSASSSSRSASAAILYASCLLEGLLHAPFRE